MDIDHIEAGAFISQAVTYGDLVFVAGLTADDPSLDVGGQTRQILAKIDRLLASAGSDKRRLLSAQVWLKDVGTWKAMNDAWTTWLDGAAPPARATVEARMVVDGILVEIMVTAARGRTAQ